MKTATLFYELHYLLFYKHYLSWIYKAIKGDSHYFTHFRDELMEARIGHDFAQWGHNYYITGRVRHICCQTL